ncbi:MAG: helix-turn-helix transcriptional regulator [Syntrophales bacterium]|jgi:transcriptional regulator with XRE-family HTH domain
MNIGTELKAIMEKEGITGYRIFKETNIEQSYISRILHNKVNLSYLTLKRILDVMGYRICFEKISKPSKGRKGVRRK